METKRFISIIDGTETPVFITDSDGKFLASALYNTAQGRMLKSAAQLEPDTDRFKTVVALTEAEVTEQIEEFLKKLGKNVGPLREAPPRPDLEKAYRTVIDRQADADEPSR